MRTVARLRDAASAAAVLLRRAGRQRNLESRAGEIVTALRSEQLPVPAELTVVNAASVSALVAAIESNLRAESRDLLAADVRVSARRPLPEELVAFFADVPHERTDVTELAAWTHVTNLLLNLDETVTKG